MIKRHDLGARAARARIRSGGGGGTRRGLALLALALLAACSALAVDLAPSRAQYGTVASRITIKEENILGSFDVRNYFIVYAEVWDANGNLVHGPGAGWSPNAWQITRVSQIITGTNVTFGRAYSAYQVVSPGEVTITLTVGSASASITLQLGEPVASQASEPSSIVFASPFTSRLSETTLLAAPDALRQTWDGPDRVTVTALVTDANGAAVPDGTPVEWELWRFVDKPWPKSRGETGRGWGWWVPVSVDRTTTNGAATGTWRLAVSGQPDANAVLVIARAGPAVGAVVAEANRKLWRAQDRPAAIEIIDAPERWESVPAGEPVTLRARLLNLYGAPVSNTTYQVRWRFHEYGEALALGKPEIVTRVTTARSQVDGTRPNADGVASATYTPRYPGTIWVRAYETTGGAERVLLDTVAFTVGDYYPPPADLALNLRLLNDSDAIVPIGSTLRVGAELTYSGPSEFEQALHITSGTLRTLGSLEWEAGRSRFDVSAQSALTRRTVLLDHLAWHSGRTGRGAEGGRAEGQCKGVSEGGGTAWTCALDLGDAASLTIPPGTRPGVYTISGTLSVNGREYHGALELTVVAPGSVDEVAEVSFDFAPQERGAQRGAPYPATIAAGESTKLRLTALNENGTASAPDGITSILLTTTSGSLSTPLGGGCTAGDGLICGIPVSALTASNTDQIPITLTHPGPDKAGITTVQATLVSSDGEAFNPPPLSVTFKGAAASLAISEPATGLLGSITADDDRDQLTLTVTATDASGNDVEVPYRAPRAVITDPDGERVSSGISVVWTEDGPDRDEAHDRFTRNAANAVEATIRSTAAAASPLAPGEYTLELRTGDHTATRTFTVVGPVGAVTLGEPQGDLQLNGRISLSATIRDAAGAPVPDGTPVEWTEHADGEATVLVQLAADRTTTDGVASAEYWAADVGVAVVTARADDIADLARISIPAPADGSGSGGGAAAGASGSGAAGPPPTGAAVYLSSALPGAFTVWLGDSVTTAAALLNDLPGVGSISFWQGLTWRRYSGPTSVDFLIKPNAILWLGD